MWSFWFALHGVSPEMPHYDNCAFSPVIWLHPTDGILHRGFMQYELSADHKTILVPTEKIFYDESFNCRQPFTEESVLELARDIETSKLRIPLSVQPANEVLSGLPPGFEFRLIAGFRRFVAAAKILKWDKLPVMVMEGLSEQEARRWNYKENVERRQLTFEEEAQGLLRLYPPGTAITKIAQDMHKSTGWVKARMEYHSMPDEVKRGVREGRIFASDIVKLARLPPDGRLDALRRLYEHQDKSLERKVTLKTLESKRRRSVTEIKVKIVQLAERLGDGVWCDALRWAAGIITPEDLDRAVNEWDRLSDLDS